MKEEDGLSIKALKLSKLSKHFCVIQEIKKEEDGESSIKDVSKIDTFSFKLTLYDLKKLYEIGHTDLITTKY